MNPIQANTPAFLSMDISEESSPELTLEITWELLKNYLSSMHQVATGFARQELEKESLIFDKVKKHPQLFANYFFKKMQTNDFDLFIDVNSNYNFQNSTIESLINTLYVIIAEADPLWCQAEFIQNAIFEIPLDRLCHVFLNKDHPMALPIAKPRFNLQSFPLSKLLTSPRELLNVELLGSDLQKKKTIPSILFARSFLDQIKQSPDPSSLLSQLNRLGKEVTQFRLRRFILESSIYHDLLIFQNLADHFIVLYQADCLNKTPSENKEILLFIYKLLKGIDHLGQECRLNLLYPISIHPSQIASQKYALVIYAFLNIQTTEDGLELIKQLKEAQKTLEIQDENGRTFLMFFMEKLNPIWQLIGECSEGQYSFIINLFCFFQSSSYEYTATDHYNHTVLAYVLDSTIGMTLQQGYIALPYAKHYHNFVNEFNQLPNNQSFLDIFLANLERILQDILQDISNPPQKEWAQKASLNWFHLAKTLTDLNVTPSSTSYEGFELFFKTYSDSLKDIGFDLTDLKNLLYSTYLKRLSILLNTSQHVADFPDPLLTLTENLTLDNEDTKVPFWKTYSLQQLINDPNIYQYTSSHYEQVRKSPYKFALKIFPQIPSTHYYLLSDDNQTVFFPQFELLLNAFNSTIQQLSNFNTMDILKKIFQLPLMDAYRIFYKDLSSLRFPIERLIKTPELAKQLADRTKQGQNNSLFFYFAQQCEKALGQPAQHNHFDSHACKSTLNFLIPLLATGETLKPSDEDRILSLCYTATSKDYPHIHLLMSSVVRLSHYFANQNFEQNFLFMKEWRSFLTMTNEEEMESWLNHLKENNRLTNSALSLTKEKHFFNQFLSQLDRYGKLLLSCNLSSFSAVQTEALNRLCYLYDSIPDDLRFLKVSTFLNASSLIHMSVEFNPTNNFNNYRGTHILQFVIYFIKASQVDDFQNSTILCNFIKQNILPLVKNNHVEKLEALIEIVKAFSDKGVKVKDTKNESYSLLMQLKKIHSSHSNESRIKGLLQQVIDYLTSELPQKSSSHTLLNADSIPTPLFISGIQDLLDRDLKLAQTLYQKLAKQLANHWNTESLQVNLRRLMALASGTRKIDLSLALDEEGNCDARGIQAILKPFQNLLENCPSEKTHIAKAVIQDAIRTLPLEFSNQLQREGFFNLNSHGLDSWLSFALEPQKDVEQYMQQQGISTLAFTNEEASKHVAAIRDFLFYFSLKEVEIRAKNLQTLLAQQRLTSTSYVCKAAALFYSTHNQSYVYPLTIVQQMPSGSIVAIGEDTGRTKAMLQDIVQLDGAPLNPSQLQALKDYYEQHKSLKDFYLLSPIPKCLIATRPDEMESSSLTESHPHQNALSLEDESESALSDMLEDKPSEQVLEEEQNIPSRQALKMELKTSSIHAQNNNNNNNNNNHNNPVSSSKMLGTHHLRQMIIGHDSLNLLNSTQSQTQFDSDQDDESERVSPNKKRKANVNQTLGLGAYRTSEPNTKKSKTSPSVEEGAIFDISATLIRKSKQTELILQDNSLESILHAIGDQTIEKIKFIKDISQSETLETLLKTTEAICSSLNRALKWQPVDSFADHQHKNYQKNTIETAFRLESQKLGYLACYEPGLGKTKAGIGVCHEAQKASPRPILIIVPNSLKPQWREDLYKHFFSMRRDYYASLIESWEQLTIKQRVLITQATQDLTHSQSPKIDECKKLLLKKEAELKNLPQASSQADKLKKKSLQQEIRELHRKQKIFTQRLTESQALVKSLPIANHKKSVLQETLILDLSLIVGSIYDQVIDYTSKTIKNMEFNANQPSTHYKIAITTIYALNGLTNSDVQKLPWSKILIDEAHEFSWDFANSEALKDKKQALRILNLLDDLSNTHGTSPFLMTGTPFVNCLGDLFAQIRLANPKHRFFPLMAVIKNREAFLNTCLSKILKEKQQASDIIKPLADWLIAAEHCRQLFSILMDRQKKSEESIRQAWTTPDNKILLPAAKKRPTNLELTALQKQIYQQHFKGKNVFQEETHLANFLFHPSFLINEKWKKAKSAELKTWIQTMSQEEVAQFIGQSSLLSFIFTNPEIKQALESGKRAIFFLPQKKFATALKALFKRMFRSYAPSNQEAFKVKIYNGDKNPEIRSVAVQSFEEKNGKTRVLMLTPKAGGVGLNLPSAEYVFNVAPWWNQALGKQMAARATRAGQEGEPFIYTLNFGTPLELHKGYASKTKKLWSQAFLSKKSTEETLKLFVNALIHEYVSVLRSAPDIQMIEQKVTEQTSKLKSILNPALDFLLEQLQDPSNSFAKQIQTVCQIITPSLESHLSIPKKVKIGSIHFQIVPLPVQDAQRARLLAYSINAHLPKIGGSLLAELNDLQGDEWEAFIECPKDFILGASLDSPIEQIHQLNQSLNIKQAQGTVRWFKIDDSQQNSSNTQILNLVSIDPQNPGKEGAPRLTELSTRFGKRYFMLIKLA